MRFKAELRQPEKLTSVETGRSSGPAQDLRVACANCHFLRDPAQSLRDGKLPQAPEDLKDFHQGLKFQHGSATCASCHVPDRADVLHLATGELIPTTDALRLCAQCHGPQWRDYQHGAHGGMNGHWDLSKGPRTRNHCVDCHDPHTPAYVGGSPVLPPRDRRPLAAAESHHE